MRREIITTLDGSHTLYHQEMGEHYHSTNGAIQESKHVFIDAGYKAVDKQAFSILEIGFGTGLNAFLSLIESGTSKKKVHYSAIELYPLPFEQIQQINYPDHLGYAELYHQLHECNWNEWVKINDAFYLHKIEADLKDIIYQEKYDLVYFDAFSPEIQAELWTDEIFERIATSCNPKAVLTTYCAKGAVRRSLQKAGFTVERLPGPAGKREILRAVKH